MIKVIGLFITILLVVFYDYLPQRTLLVYPGLTQSTKQSVDSWNGGSSSVSWLGELPLKWTCHIRKSEVEPYCGIYLTWSDETPYQRIDFTQYSEFELSLNYQGEAKYVQVFFKNVFEIPNFPDQVAHAKYTSIGVDVTSLNNTIILPFDEFNVADWWLFRYDISPTENKAEFDEVLLIGFDFRPPMIFGDHEFTLHSLKAVGHYFSKEAMYLGIIIFWAILLVSEGVIRYVKLLASNKENEISLSLVTQQSANYKKQSQTDPLTGALNRQGLDRILKNLVKKKRISKYALLILDIDHFKSINDEHGHDIGDQVLAELSARIDFNTRFYDFFARWGGEEFVLVFRSTEAEKTQAFAEKMRLCVASSSFIDGKIKQVTVSIGATQLSASESFDESFRRADKGLYEAKKTGRNKTVFT